MGDRPLSARLRVARRRGAGHHGVEPRAFLLEAAEQRALQHSPARQLDLHGIDEAAVDQDFEMQVRPGRQSGRADIADHLSLAHLLAGLHAAGESRHVAVGGLITVSVPDADVLAVAAFPADLVDKAVARGEDRRPRRRAPVYPGMHLVVAEQGMVTTPEAGRYVSV